MMSLRVWMRITRRRYVYGPLRHRIRWRSRQNRTQLSNALHDGGVCFRIGRYAAGARWTRLVVGVCLFPTLRLWCNAFARISRFAVMAGTDAYWKISIAGKVEEMWGSRDCIPP